MGYIGRLNLTTRSWVISFTVIILLVSSSILHKANTYSFSLFNYSLLLYAAIWVFVLALLTAILYIATSKKKHPALIILAGFFLLNYGEIQDFLLNTIKSKWLASTWILIILFILSLIVSVYYYRRKQSGTTKVSTFIILLLLLLNCFEIFTIFTGKNKIGYAIPGKAANARIQPAEAGKPDIYFLVFDSYTANATLQSYWQYPNDSITAFLHDRGFKVTAHASSPYDFTPVSINAILNLDSLIAYQNPINHDYVNFNYGRQVLNSSFAVQWLRSQGYNISCYSILSPGYDLDRFYPFAPDEPLHWLRRQTIERIWIIPSLWNRLLGVVGVKSTRIQSALSAIDQYNYDVLDSLTQRQPSSGNRFVYAHFFTPHRPYLYKRDGSKRDLSEVTNLNPKLDSAYYLDQVIYTNSMIKKIVSSLLHDTGRNKIIIIQGDHGYRDYPKKVNGNKLAVFNAVYFPDGNYQMVSDSMLTVNTFRIVFNQYFNQSWPLIQP